MTEITDEMLEAMLTGYYNQGKGAWGKRARDHMRRAVIAMRAFEPAPTRSEDARVEAVCRFMYSAWNDWSQQKQGEMRAWAVRLLAAIDAHDPLRHVSGGGIEASAKAAAPALWSAYDEEMRQSIRADMRRAIAAYLAQMFPEGGPEWGPRSVEERVLEIAIEITDYCHKCDVNFPCMHDRASCQRGFALPTAEEMSRLTAAVRDMLVVRG